MDVEGPHESCWIEPLQVPKCLESRLQNFYFVRFSFLDHELELVKYILKNAQVLKTMGIHNGVSNWEEEFLIRWEMLDFPRGSLTCQLEFLTVYSLALSFSYYMIEWLPTLIISCFK